ncbi:hypothetical protein RR48_05263 [Papilio machaon]|uniref:BLUF domain-containing protein n=1 Tax=Papilio machaon TaxID=76193 RepID=A0A0N1PJ07_PAPMA|nr:testis-expressed protein 47 [Papilio machaon]KPJ14285.1 hypothetical protein RR48_05263 [Papilio machaon]
MALPELDTRSVLDTVEENFTRVGLKTYAIRMIYAGEHLVKKEEIIRMFSKTVEDVNSSYCEIHVTGLLLVYDSFFVHVIEGSEDTVHRQIRFLFNLEAQMCKEKAKNEAAEAAAQEKIEEGNIEGNAEKECKIFRRLKTIMVYHSMQTLMFSGWRALTARPPSLVGNLDVYGPIAEHMEQLRIFLNKMSKLCDLAEHEHDLSFEGLSAVDPKIETLPEVTLLDFLLESRYILDLRRTAHLHRRVDDYVFYFENVWPLPTHFTPRFLYKLKIDDSFVDPLPVMPWEKVKKDVDDEGRETERDEDQTDTSDSD